VTKPILEESESSLGRSLLLQLPATITAIAALGALVYTARSVDDSREQLDLLRQGQVSERFSKSIEGLGSSSVDMRVGAIYSLERIAQDSPRDRQVVMEIISSFVRTRSPASQRPDGSFGCPTEQKIGPDIQAAVSVIARRIREPKDTWVDLSRSCLRIGGANQGDFQKTILYLSDLSGASIMRANFSGTVIIGTQFNDTILYGAIFHGAEAVGADFTGAQLNDADFEHANLQNARFVQSKLAQANMREARLSGTIFQDVELSQVDMRGSSK
jgi:uncharacterized protein YjbI with pentapeptide repeats